MQLDVQENVIKGSLVHTMGMIARALHRQHLQADYELLERAYLLKQLKEYLASESVDTATNVLRVLCANTAALLAFHATSE